jgi:Rrf2 family protein
MINSRFTVAVHLLTLLGVARETEPTSPVTSEFAAESVHTNPVVVRRILGSLRRAGFVRSQPGPSGGWQLDRQPASISLRDVYRAVEDEQLFSMHRQPPSTACPVGRNIQSALQGYFQEAEQAMESALGARSIADVVLDVKRSPITSLTG